MVWVTAGAVAFVTGALWTLVYATVASIATVRARRMARSPTPAAPGNHVRVLLIRPCRGDEPHLQATLRSVQRARWSFELDVVMTVASEHDPAWPIIDQVAQELREAGIRCRATVAATSAPNQKVGQLATVIDQHDSPTDIVVVVDSDVDLQRLDLDPLIATVTSSSTIAAAWHPPVETAAPKGWGDRASQAVLGASLHAFPLLGALDPGGMVGKVMAVDAKHLAQVGGFSGLANTLGEDMELGRRLAARGWQSRMLPRVVPSLASGRTVGATVARYARWLAVIRSQRPALLWTYPLLLAAPTLLLPLSLGLTSWSTAGGLTLFGSCLVTRYFIARNALRRAGLRRSTLQTLVDAFAADTVLIAALGRALASREVQWRDRYLRVGRHGQLELPPRVAQP